LDEEPGGKVGRPTSDGVVNGASGVVDISEVSYLGGELCNRSG